jgi:hypothetical protein
MRLSLSPHPQNSVIAQHPGSPVHQAIGDDFVRRIFIGLVQPLLNVCLTGTWPRPALKLSISRIRTGTTWKSSIFHRGKAIRAGRKGLTSCLGLDHTAIAVSNTEARRDCRGKKYSSSQRLFRKTRGRNSRGRGYSRSRSLLRSGSVWKLFRIYRNEEHLTCDPTRRNLERVRCKDVCPDATNE